MTTPTPSPAPGLHPAVAVARGYLGTPFHHQARVRGVGVDCVGLVICVARELGHLPPAWDVTGYARQPDGSQLMHHLADRLVPVPQADMRPGDVVCVAFARHPQHVGVVGDYVHGGLSLIHADGQRGRVLETRLLFTEAMRFVQAFRWPGEGAAPVGLGGDVGGVA